MSKTTYKTARTIKPYPVKFGGYQFTVPKGSTVSNNTACGCSDSYRFWIDWKAFVENLTGFKNSMLAHDLEYRGLNINRGSKLTMHPVHITDKNARRTNSHEFTAQLADLNTTNPPRILTTALGNGNNFIFQHEDQETFYYRQASGILTLKIQKSGPP
jgi:hypothetical protein